MKRVLFFLTIILMGSHLGNSTLYAQDSTQNKQNNRRPHQKLQFLDKNGDGYNDLLPDDDGDGIPNSLDPDWQKLHKKGKHKRRIRFIDLDGDGINDLIFSGKEKKKHPIYMKNGQPAGAMGDKGQPHQRGHHGRGKGRK